MHKQHVVAAFTNMHVYKHISIYCNLYMSNSSMVVVVVVVVAVVVVAVVVVAVVVVVVVVVAVATIMYKTYTT